MTPEAKRALLDQGIAYLRNEATPDEVHGSTTFIGRSFSFKGDPVANEKWYICLTLRLQPVDDSVGLAVTGGMIEFLEYSDASEMCSDCGHKHGDQPFVSLIEPLTQEAAVEISMRMAGMSDAADNIFGDDDAI